MPASARSIANDPFQNHRFKVYDVAGKLNLDPPSAGFSLVTMPEMTIDTSEYREGVWTYSKKFPTRPHFSQVSLHKGIMRNDTALMKLALAAAEGHNYRVDLVIQHFHRADVSGLTSYISALATREVHCFGCTPVRYRPSSDLDSLSSDVSVEELDFEVEYFKVFMNHVEVTP